MLSNDPKQAALLDDHRTVSVKSESPLKEIRVRQLFSEAITDAVGAASHTPNSPVSRSPGNADTSATGREQGIQKIDPVGKLVDALFGPGKSRVEMEFIPRGAAQSSSQQPSSQQQTSLSNPELQTKLQDLKSAEVAGAVTGTANGGLFNPRNGVGDGSLAISSQLDAEQVRSSVRSVVEASSSQQSTPQPNLVGGVFVQGDLGLTLGRRPDPSSGNSLQTESAIREQVNDMREGSKADLLKFMTAAYDALKQGDHEQFIQISDLASGRFSRGTMKAFQKMERDYLERTSSVNLSIDTKIS